MRTVAVFAAVLFVSISAACGGSNVPAATPATTSGTQGVFASAPPYALTRPAKSAASAHTVKGAPPPSGTACLTCHKTGGTAPAFAFAGTVYTDDSRAAPNPDAEIAVDDGSGKEQIAHADADGIFWIAGGTIALPAHAGARQSAKIVKMGGAVESADCNGCHDAKFPIALTPPK